MKAGIAIVAVSLLVAGAPALAQQSTTAAKPGTAKSPPAPRVAAKNPGPNKAASREPQSAPAVLLDIPDAQRLAIADLIWLGGFDGLSAEQCNGHAADAIRAFQRRSGSKNTGMLSHQERASLAQAAAAHEAAVGWRLIDDTATGALLGVPEKILPRASSTRTGSRWTSAQGQIQIETFRMHDASLSALFDQEKKTAQRYVGYSALNQNSFVMTGEQKLKCFVEGAA